MTLLRVLPPSFETTQLFEFRFRNFLGTVVPLALIHSRLAQDIIRLTSLLTSKGYGNKNQFVEQVVFFLNVMYTVVVVTSGAFIGCLCEELNVKSAENLVIAVGLCGFDFSNRPKNILARSTWR